MASKTKRADLADEAVEVALSIRVDHAQARADLSNALAADDPERAVEVAQTIKDDYGRARALAALAKTLKRADLADEALNLARCTDEGQRGVAIGEACEALVHHHPDRAVQAARSIAEEPFGTIALAGVAGTLAEHDPDRAIEIALSMTNDWQRAVTLRRVAEALAEHHFDRALEVANSIPVDALRANTVGKFASVYATHDPDRAVAVARSIDETWERAEMLAKLASVLERDDLVEEAMQVAGSITDERSRGWALTSLLVRWLGTSLTEPSRWPGPLLTTCSEHALSF